MNDTAVIDHRPVERIWPVRIGDDELVAAVMVTPNACTVPPPTLRLELHPVPDGIEPGSWYARAANQALAMSACEVIAVRILPTIDWRA